MSEWLTAGQTRAFGTAMDIANAIIDAGKLSLDVSRAENIRDAMLNTLSNDLREEVTYIIGLATQSTSDVLELFKTNLGGDFKYLAKELMNQGVQSATGYKLSGMMIGQRAKIYSVMNIVDTEADVCLSIPENIIKLKASRYFNKLLHPNDPSEIDAFIMTQYAYWTPRDFINRLREHDGLTQGDAEQVAIIRQFQVGAPSLHDAWMMWKKGLKKEGFFYDVAQKGHGWTKENAQALDKLYTYDFSPSELMRMSDFVPLDLVWLSAKLSKLGIAPEDVIVLLQAIQKRVVRDELTKEYGLFLDSYAWGLMTDKELSDFLTASNFSASEIAYRLQTATLMKDKTMFKLLRDAEIYLYRKCVSNENQLLTVLQNLGISLDIANAIVRNEACKKGIDWEIPE